MARTLYLDFDGTLTDPRQRMYNLFMELAPEATFSFEEYWNIKRNRLDQSTLLKNYFEYSNEQIATFKTQWLTKIEEPPRLALDTPFPGTTEVLTQLAATHNLVLVTARQQPQFVSTQLQSYGWTNLFTKLLITQQQKSKAELIQENGTPTPTDILVGDTGEDIKTAQTLGLTSIAVCSGFLNEDILKTYNPTAIIQDITHIHATGLL